MSKTTTEQLSEPPNWNEYYKPDIECLMSKEDWDGHLSMTKGGISRITAGASFYRLIRAIFRGEPASLLDIGCGNGAVVQAATAAGVLAVGIDTNERAIELARSKPGKFICADYQNPEVARERYEVVTMFDVIEHFVDPIEALKSALKHVANGGTLIFTTPNTDGWLSRKQGKHYFHYTQDHEVLFGVRAINVLMKRCGITNAEISDLGEYLQKVTTPQDWYAVVKYTKYRSHLLVIVRL